MVRASPYILSMLQTTNQPSLAQPVPVCMFSSYKHIWLHRAMIQLLAAYVKVNHMKFGWE